MFAETTQNNRSISVVIIGFGYVGQRLASLWTGRRAAITALSRHNKPSETRNPRLSYLRADLDKLESYKNLDCSQSVVYYLAPPSPDHQTDRRCIDFISSLGPDNQPAKIIYISATGVYGDQQGHWVTEQTAVNPHSLRSARRRSAELAFENYHNKTGTPLVILRVAGIYGPDRLPLTRIERKEPVLDQGVSPWSNHIHVDDLCRICLAVGNQNMKHQIYNVCDGHPLSMTDYFFRVADIAGIERPPVISWDQARDKLSPTMLEFLRESKRVDNTRIINELNLTLDYRDLDCGIKASL
ncbi:MAG: SDR family oxidoreductase [Gammaproteobacteria bacterium]